MMECQCLRRIYSSGSIKFVNAYTIGPRNTNREQDCNKCKHQLACLINPECNREFEGKA